MKEVSLDSLEKFIVERISRETGIPAQDIDTNDEFVKYGLDSLKAVLIIDELEKSLGMQINPLYFWNYPTIKTFCNLIFEKYCQENNSS